MKRIITIAFAIIVCIQSYAQSPFSGLAEQFSPVPVPIDKLYDTRPTAPTYPILLKENAVIPMQLYTDFRCTEYFSASYGEITEPSVEMMTNVPNTDLKLFAVRVGGLTEYSKTVLVIVNSRGDALDVLEAEVCWGPVIMYAKQARIDESFNIIVYSIHPENMSKPLPVNETIPSFRGWREDVLYRINKDGRFVKREEIRYKKRLFRYTDLTKDLWLGRDVPEKGSSSLAK